MSQVYWLTERGAWLGPREQEALCPSGQPAWVTGAAWAMCPVHAPSPRPMEWRAVPHHTLVLQVCTPVRLPRWGMGSVGPLFPAWVTQR